MGRRWSWRAGPAALALGALLLGGLTACGPGLGSPGSVVQRMSKTMAGLAGYRISGSSRALQTTTSFAVYVRRDGAFRGSLDIAVPGAPTFRSQVVATPGSVYVRSPTELQELGISALPGNLDPATTWVLQPKAVAKSYRASVEPFSGAGLTGTLRQALKGPLRVHRAKLRGRAVLVVEERGGSSSLRLFISSTGYQLLELAITGAQPISLRYSDFGHAEPVPEPPSSKVYVPPTPAAPG